MCKESGIDEPPELPKAVYREKPFQTFVVAMHTIVTCRPDTDSEQRERAVESIRSSCGPLTTISSTHTQIILDLKQASSFFLALALAGRPSLLSVLATSGVERWKASDRRAHLAHCVGLGWRMTCVEVHMGSAGRALCPLEILPCTMALSINRALSV